MSVTIRIQSIQFSSIRLLIFNFYRSKTILSLPHLYPIASQHSSRQVGNISVLFSLQNFSSRLCNQLELFLYISPLFPNGPIKLGQDEGLRGFDRSSKEMWRNLFIFMLLHLQTDSPVHIFPVRFKFELNKRSFSLMVIT